MVLLRVKRKNNGVTYDLLKVQRKKHVFYNGFAEGPIKKTMVLHGFCLGSKEIHWFYIGFAQGNEKTMVLHVFLLSIIGKLFKNIFISKMDRDTQGHPKKYWFPTGLASEK